MSTLNLGILAHVDAGKTTLTERLLFAAGVTDTLGSVDDGTTQTDSLELERRRGITIRAAVVAFTLGDLAVNLIDTPGHPDFIAEVDRSLAVLDGAVLVVSAVEGVQAQTVVLLRALQRLRVPTLLFVNKVDRGGADPDRVLAMIRDRLTDAVVPLADRDAVLEALAERDDAVLTHLVDDGFAATAASVDLTSLLAGEVARGGLHPVLFGSARTGAGIPELMTAVRTLLPAARGDHDGPASGLVFKVERGPGGDRVAYVRLRAGAVRVRDRVHLGPDRDATVTGVEVLQPRGAAAREVVVDGEIARLSGLRDVRVGDRLGTERPPPAANFAPPTLETAVVPRDPAQKGALHHALAEIAEQDPLIGLRVDETSQDLYVSLYGEVQKEVLEQTLALEHDVAVDFRASTTLCIERPAGVGRAVTLLGEEGNRHLATVGLRVEPGPPGSGLRFHLAAELNTLPLYVFHRVDDFRASMAEYVATALRCGPAGWAVHDAVVTMTHSGYSAPLTGAGDFRKLTQTVLRTALERAGTVVCEPIHRFRLEAPADVLSAVLGLLAEHEAVPGAPEVTGSWLVVEGDIPAAELHRLRQRLAGRTHGEGLVEASFDRYEPARPRMRAVAARLNTLPG